MRVEFEVLPRVLYFLYPFLIKNKTFPSSYSMRDVENDEVLRDFQIQMLPAEVPSRIGTSLSVTVGPKIQKFGV